MEKIINIVIDASGSMVEDDKRAVVKYLLNGIYNCIKKTEFNHVRLKLYQWGEKTKQIDDIEKTKLEFVGKSEIKGLEILDDLIDKDGTILFVSDGNMEMEEKKKVKELAKTIITIYVGIDANKTLLQDISTNKNVYSVMDFMQALAEANK